jgi:GTP-binding protein
VADARPLPLHHLGSAARADQLAPALVEWAIVGRSNVGKSSLINALANRKNLAKTSKTPGATRLINVYELEGAPAGRWLVDLPGYGFARVAAGERQRWQRMIEGYLTGRDSLAGVLLLIDGEVGPTALDLQTVEWLAHIDLPLRFVATKTDKLGPSRRGARRDQMASKLGVARNEVLWVSAEKGLGVPELRAALLGLLQPLSG